MHIHTVTASALSLLLLSISAPAAAVDRSGVYVFAGSGKATVEWTDQEEGGADGERRHSARPSSSLLGAGYRVNRHLALEMADVRTGGVRQQGVGLLSARSRSVGVVGVVPLGPWELFAKAGVARTTHTFEADRARRPAAAAEARSRRSHSVVSLGARFHLTPSLSIRVDRGVLGAPDRTFLADSGIDASNTRQWTAGLNYQF